jgi:hypothetical protein
MTAVAICWTTGVTACLRSEVSQELRRGFRGLPSFKNAPPTIWSCFKDSSRSASPF